MKFLVCSPVVFALVGSCLWAADAAMEDIEKANHLLKSLRHRQTKTDEHGHVWYLDISEQNAVSDETLAVVRHLPHLRELYVIYCPIRGAGLKHLAHHTHMEKLDLFSTQIDNAALEHVAKLTTLKYLDIRSVGVSKTGRYRNGYGFISDDGTKLISNALPNLETLLFSGTVTDEGLLHLTQLKKLRSVEIASPKVTEAGIKRLQQAMPELEINW